MLTKAQTTLFLKNVVHPDGSPVKDKLNIASGVHASPFAEAVWIQAGRDMTVCEKLLAILWNFYDEGRDGDVLSLLFLLYGLIGYRVPDDITEIGADPTCLRCFLLEFLLDLDDVFAELAAEIA